MNELFINPVELSFSQSTAGGKGRAAVLRQSMRRDGWKGRPVDVVEYQGVRITMDNTRVAVARELGLPVIPIRLHYFNDRLPPSMLGRFGAAKTWGEALRCRTGTQSPPLPITGRRASPPLPDS